MSIRFGTVLIGLLIAAEAGDLAAQGVVVDQGQFELRVGGAVVGTEDFVVRRAGLGSSDAVFANGTVAVDIGGAKQQLRSILRASPAEGAADQYQIEVTGEGALEVRVERERSGRRFVATIRSAAGAEDREFQALPGTRILELDVAHHYYFLRGIRAGGDAHVLEPRSRNQFSMVAGPYEDVELRLGPNRVPARKVAFTVSSDDVRTVWFDRQGRVLRVEIPSRRYVAERTDLVG